MTIWAKVGAVVVLAVLCFGAGWWTADSVVARKTVVVQDQSLKDANDRLAKRAREEQEAAARAQQALVDEQGKTSDLNQQLADLRSKNASLQQEIDHAPLDAPKPVPVAGQCPGNPLAGDDFGRLYEAAAQGRSTARP